jgi:hypothetical protein
MRSQLTLIAVAALALAACTPIQGPEQRSAEESEGVTDEQTGETGGGATEDAGEEAEGATE